MKKFAMIFVAIAIVISMSGCKLSIFKVDDVPATAEITTTEGDAYVVNSVNGANKTVSGASYAVSHAPVSLHLADGEKATIHFVCSACGYEVEDTIIAPFAKLYHCECPEKIDENGNACEYISITASTKEETKGK